MTTPRSKFQDHDETRTGLVIPTWSCPAGSLRQEYCNIPDEPSRLRAVASREVHTSTPLAFSSTKLPSQARCGNSWTGSSVMPFPGSRFPAAGCRPLGGADGGTRATRAPWSSNFQVFNPDLDYHNTGFAENFLRCLVELILQM